MVGRHRARSWRVGLAIGVVASVGLVACSSDKKADVPATSASTATTAAGAASTSAGGTATVAGATTVAGGSSTPATAGGDVSDKALVIARSMDVNSLDPARAYCDTCQIFLTAVYETLIGLDQSDNTTLIPRLATKWTSNTEQTEFTFDLDPTAKFADGSQVTSTDVKFSWERLRDLQGGGAYLAGLIKDIDATNPEVVKVSLTQPDSAFLAQVNASYLGIVNSKVAIAQGATTDPTTDKAESWFLANSAGSGPFALESYEENNQLRFKANDKYWGANKPKFPEVIIKQTDSAVTQRQQLEQGAVDIAMQISADVANGMSGGDIVVKQVPSFNYVYLALSPGGKGGEALTPDVRKAIREALDYPHLLDVTVAGAGRAQLSPIPNDFAGTAGLATPTQNLDDAKKLMAGQQLTLDATFPSVNVYGVDFTTAMQEVQTELKAIGVTLNLNPVEISVWAAQIGKDGIPVTMVYFAPDHTDSSQYLQYFGLIKDSAWQARSGLPIVQNEQDLLSKAFATQDPATRETIYNQLATAMVNDQVIIPIVNPNLFLASRANIKGMHYSACCNLELGLLSRG